MGTMILNIMPKEIIVDDQATADEMFPSLAGQSSITGGKGYTYSSGDSFVDGEFSNTSGTTPAALYQQAKTNYDNSVRQLGALQTKLSGKEAELGNFDAAYNSGVLPIGDDRYKNDYINKVLNNQDYNEVIDIVRTEGYGFCGSQKWGKVIGDMREVAPGGRHFAVTGVCDEGGAGNDRGYRCSSNKKGHQGQVAACIPDVANDWYQQIYVEGKAAGGIRRDVQIWLAQEWAKTMKAIRTQIVGEINQIKSQIATKTTEVSNNKASLDKAITAEEKASGQRIKEKMVDPEYLRIIQEGERVKQEVAYKKSRNQMIVLGVAGAGILVLGGLYLLKKKR